MTNPTPEHDERLDIRASDADREWVADRLQHDARQGRIQPEELQQRLELVLSAKSYRELDQLVLDLPAERDSTRRRPLAQRVAMPLTASIALAATGIIILALIIAQGGDLLSRSAASAPTGPGIVRTH